ncbi:hypothetical protein IEQ34_001394 [Dendrobium chrysotoxum]|uniref:Uncharacterized protein n=1 Tax=Dendrobium chrysotoxum TaxID=161865 RepID=A0AAV7HMG9_DENCH|nr:hypothetical protein IEQ34_001394 [Dendrobium chrysotoxum]
MKSQIIRLHRHHHSFWFINVSPIVLAFLPYISQHSPQNKCLANSKLCRKRRIVQFCLFNTAHLRAVDFLLNNDADHTLAITQTTKIRNVIFFLEIIYEPWIQGFLRVDMPCSKRIVVSGFPLFV